MKVPLSQLAHTRSGDKGDTCNIGVIALREADYPVLAREVTAERVKRHFGDLVQGAVERYELPNLGALNFLLHGALGGGGTVSLRTDAQGKTFGAALLLSKSKFERLPLTSHLDSSRMSTIGSIEARLGRNTMKRGFRKPCSLTQNSAPCRST